ncbi:unnamed protein product [Hymenolepis diminuta]|uniref:EIF2A domain-containing protein n=1 Tax=Hymenolepis diminuta TaxID=6216 RepID=A0A0R3SRZ4_HYMDI|nr:unnamed protein product [Hymenolepis diminuta]
MEDNACCCHIDASEYLGIQDAFWTPDSQNIMVLSELSAFFTVWALSNQWITTLSSPKNSNSSFAFSPDGRFLSMLEMVNGKDILHFYDTEDSNWCRFLSASLPTRDAESVHWSPNGRYIIVFDSYLYDSIAILNSDGTTLHSLNLYSENFGNNPASRFALGIRSFHWAPSGHILAVGRYDNSCLLYNHANWKILAELKHPLDKPIDPILGLDRSGDVIEARFARSLLVKPHKVAIYIERLSKEQPYYGPPLLTSTRAEEVKDAYIISKLPYTVKSVKVDPKKSNPMIGVGLCLFSPNGRYLVTRVENAPHAIWVWSIGSLHISLEGLLCHSSAVTCVQWDPRSLPTEFTRLAFCTASGRVFIWSPKGCLSMTASCIPYFMSLTWRPSGDTLLLQSSKSFCLLHLNSEEGEAIFKPLEPVWTAPSRGRDPLEEHNRDPQTPASRGTFPADEKSDLPKWALSAHRLTRKTLIE